MTEQVTVQETTLSPALAGMVASIIVPQQWSKFVQVTVQSLNAQCPRRVFEIDK